MLGSALKIIRESAGLSLSEAAKSLELSKSYLSEIENNKKTPTLDILEKYASEFNVPVSHILFFSENFDEYEGVISKKIRHMLAKGVLATMNRLV